ncbi:hypothetical protein ACH9EU_03225 [Kocuria sp. M1R5S2]|uniref:hypothetical protein n=1 Tax=Kocuria rhizosphaerae TaxID=3376285 RepID=UPI0037986E89
MTGPGGYRDHGPGVRWLAARTGRTPEELVGSPGAAASALGDALREVAALAARLESPDPEARAAARAEADDLRAQFGTAPSPGETFGKRLAAALREAAERLDDLPPPQDPRP